MSGTVVDQVIRLAAPADNAALLDLARACPMEGNLSLAIERDPDFFALCRARGTGRTYVVESDHRVVACGSVCRRAAYLLGVPATMGYVADLKVSPPARRRGLAQRLLEAIARDERELPPAPYVGSAAAGNVATDVAVRRFGARGPVARLAAMTAYQLWPFRVGGGTADRETHRAQPADEAELVDFLDRYHRRLTFAPVFGAGGFRDLLRRSPGLDLSSYRIRRRGGRIVAAVAPWNGSSLKRTRVYRMTAPLRWLSRGVRAARRVLPLPAFPAEGEVVRLVYLRHPAYADGAMDALADVVRGVVAEAASEGMHCALFTCARDDPVAACLKGIPSTTYHYQLVAGANTPDYAPRLNALAGALPYDDAALA